MKEEDLGIKEKKKKKRKRKKRKKKKNTARSTDDYLRYTYRVPRSKRFDGAMA